MLIFKFSQIKLSKLIVKEETNEMIVAEFNKMIMILEWINKFELSKHELVEF